MTKPRTYSQSTREAAVARFREKITRAVTNRADSPASPLTTADMCDALEAVAKSLRRQRVERKPEVQVPGDGTEAG